MDKIYHGCFYKNADGTNKTIVAGERCLTLSVDCFWRDPNDIKHGVKRKSRASSKPAVNFRAVDEYREGKIDKKIEFYVNK